MSGFFIRFIVPVTVTAKIESKYPFCVNNTGEVKSDVDRYI